MQNPSRWQTAHYLVIAGGLLIFILLLFADKTDLKKPTNATNNKSANPDGEMMPHNEKEAGLPALQIQGPDKEVIDKLNQQVQKTPQTPQETQTILSQLVSAYLNVNRPDYAAQFQEQLTNQQNTPQNVLQTAQLHSQATQLPHIQQDSILYQKFNLKSIEFYIQYKDNNPTDTAILIQLATRYIESHNPQIIMNGIRQLAQITQNNPNHYEANLKLGAYSLQTNQLDKAQKRFQAAIQAQPTLPEPYYYLAQVFQNQQNKPEAKKHFQKALSLTKDPTLTQAITKRLNEL